MQRPDRIALWAVAIAVVGMIAAAASAHASAGGGATNHFTHTDPIRAAPINR